ncbi:MAG: hypothetical protein P4L33_21475 [Capsulimonadaceae bacterium]|nr:hypothetical protein [Capsulimonadaceae bacterium]
MATIMEDFFIAGQKVPPGRYQLLGSHRDICLEREDTLPPSLDGRVAVYIQHQPTWAELKSSSRHGARTG